MARGAGGAASLLCARTLTHPGGESEKERRMGRRGGSERATKAWHEQPDPYASCDLRREAVFWPEGVRDFTSKPQFD